MGYPNPVQIPLREDATFRGICVYVPNEPEYLRALLGSLSGLATWRVWELDNEQSAARSAELWKMANVLTLATWANGCGCEDDMFNCEEMKDCLIEIARAISVNVNVNVENSCGGSSTTLYCVDENGDIIINPPPAGDYPILPTLPLPDGMEEPPTFDVDEENPPPAGFDTWDAYNEKACYAANVLYDWALKVLDRLIELLTQDVFTFVAAFAVIANLVTGGWGVVFSRGMILKLAELYARLAINTDIFVAALILARQNLMENKQAYICALYQNRGSAGEWENDLVTWLFEASSGGMDSLNERPYYLDLLRMALPGLASIGIMYDAFTYNYPVEDGLDCSLCEPEIPYWDIAVMSSGYNGTSTLALTRDNLQGVAGSVNLYKGGQYGAYVFAMALEEIPLGFNTASFDIQWAVTGNNPGWRLDFFDTNNQIMTSERVLLPSTGQYQKVFSGTAFQNVRKVQLIRTDEIYTAPAPRIFTFDLNTTWVVAS